MPILHFSSLPCGAFFEAAVKEAKELDVADKAPRSLVHESRRDFPDKALYAEGRAETLKHVNNVVPI